MRYMLAFAILAFGLVVLIVNHDSGQSFGMANDDFGNIVYALPILLMISTGILSARHRLGESLRNLLVWVMIVLVLMTGYVFRNDFQATGNRLLAGLMPGQAVTVANDDGVAEVVLHKSLGGHFETTVAMGAVEVPVLIDTGASSVALRFEDAVRIGISPDDLVYSASVYTANGRANAAPVLIPEIRLGAIVRTNIRGVVLEEGKLDQTLLGMSYLSSLSSLQMQSDELRLRD